MKRKLFILGSLACLGLASSTQAAIMYNYVAVPPAGGITNGATNVVSLYFQETLTNGSTSVINNADNGGLYAAGAAIVEQTGSTGVTVMSAAPNSQTEPAGFTGNNFYGYPGAPSGPNASTIPVTGLGGAFFALITSNSAAAFVGPTITSTAAGTTINKYLLGTVTLNVGTAPQATFLVESLHDAPQGQGYLHAGVDGNTIDVSQDDFDAGGVQGGSGVNVGTGADGNPTTFAITSPIPEPGSLMMCGLVASGLAFRRRRSQKA